MKDEKSIENILSSIKRMMNDKSRNYQTEEEKAESEISENQNNEEDVFELVDVAAPSSKKDEEYLISDKVAKETSTTIKDFINAASKITKKEPKIHAKTIEDIVIEIIKPYLVKWMDENLQSIITQLVEQELKRLTDDEK